MFSGVRMVKAPGEHTWRRLHETAWRKTDMTHTYTIRWTDGMGWVSAIFIIYKHPYIVKRKPLLVGAVFLLYTDVAVSKAALQKSSSADDLHGAPHRYLSCSSDENPHNKPSFPSYANLCGLWPSSRTLRSNRCGEKDRAWYWAALLMALYHRKGVLSMP